MSSRFPIRLRQPSRWRFAFCAALAAALACGHCAAAERPLRVLIFSGQNNHDWKSTTPVLEKILAGSGRFSVEVTGHPETCTAETFAGCDVVLSNWNGFGPGAAVKEWPPETREALMSFVRNGGGFVVVHAGGSSFPDWADYQQVIGGTWGKGTGHGRPHAFEVKFPDAAHPIVRGLAPFQTTDELWHRMALQPGVEVVATAFSALDQGGTGNDEPVAMVTRFGKGRCFNLVLGHDAAAMQTPQFQMLLIRGTEWAATGGVSEDANNISSNTNP